MREIVVRLVISYLIGVVIGIALLLLTSCGKTDEKKPVYAEPSLVEKFKVKYDNYLEWSKALQDEHGFVESGECDSLLHTSLYSIANPNVNIEAAQESRGVWLRRPVDKPCYANGQDLGASSTISRDMLVGLYWHIWYYKRLDLAEGLWAYGSDHTWKMGEGAASKVLLTPNMIFSLSRIIGDLGGGDHWVSIVPQWLFPTGGYAAHLDVLSVLLEGRVEGEIPDKHMQLLKGHNNDWGGVNALYSYAAHKYVDGNYTEALSTLLDEKWFPNDRLPNGSDRYTTNVWSESPGSNGLQGYPDQTSRLHSGSDLLFVGKLILEEMGLL
jgi:hypothetical protein